MKHVFYIILTVKTAADVGPTSPRRRPDVGWTSAIDLGPTSARRRLDLGWTSEHAGISDIQPTSCRGWTDVGPTSACRCRVADVTPTSADVGPTSACLLGYYLPRSPRSPEVTIFKTADEIAYAESTGGVFVAIGPVVPEL